MKYFTKKDNETMKEFIRKVGFEARGQYYRQDISPILGKGVQIMSIVNESLANLIKLEVSMYEIEQLSDYYQPLSARPLPSPKHPRIDNLGNIEDLYK